MTEGEMSEMEYLRAMFFSSDEEFAALKAANKRRRTTKASRVEQQRRAEMQALRQVVRGFDALRVMGDNCLVPALNYINNRYGSRRLRAHAD